MGSGSDDPAGTQGVAWEFVPTPAPASRREELLRLRLALEAALRVGHGIGARFSLVLTGGPSVALRLRPHDPTSERWAARALVPAYASGEWLRARRDPREAHGRRWTARRTAPHEPDPPFALREPGGALRSLVTGLATLRRGTTLELTFCPRSLGRVPAWVSDLVLGPRTEGAARRAAPLPANAGRPEGAGRPRPRPLVMWTTRLDLVLPGVTRHPLEVGVVESAWRALGGDLRLTPCRLGERFRPMFPVTEDELVALLPSWEVPLASTGPGPEHRDGLPVGREATGAVVELPLERDDGRHVAVLGETGMGKSSLLVALAVRASRKGGVVVLDPLGETATAIRAELGDAPDRVRFIAPGSPGIGLNALEGSRPASGAEGIRAERRRDDLVHALRRVRTGRYLDQGYWGPRLEEMLGRALRAAATLPDGTLEDAHALLAHAPLRRRPGRSEDEGSLRKLIDRVRDRPDDAEGARRLLFEVVRNPTLTSLLCARHPTLHPSELVRPGAVVLVSGAASEVGEATARYLLSVALALVWSELLSRPHASKTFVVLDEAQWFAHESLSEMLRVGRRRNAHVVLATQSLSSLPEGVREAVSTNVADLVVFRGSPDDAQKLARSIRGVTAEEILALPRGSAVVLVGKGERLRRVRTARLPHPLARAAASSSPAHGRSGYATPAPAATPGTPARRGGPPSPSGSDLVGPSHHRTVAALLDRLRSHAARQGTGGLLRIPLAELADGAWAGDPALRPLGSRLGRAGAIVRSQRTPKGVVWWLDPARLPAGPALPSGAEARRDERSTDRPRSRAPGRSPRGPGPPAEKDQQLS